MTGSVLPLARVALAALAALATAATSSAALAKGGFGEVFADLSTPSEVALPQGAVDMDELAVLEAAIEADIDALEATEIGAGMASWYGSEFSGRRTASGERFDPAGLTAAHRTLPFGSKVRVTSASTGRSVIVRITDRGPFHGNRVIDLSRAAAERIGLRAAGSGRVTLALLDR